MSAQPDTHDTIDKGLSYEGSPARDSQDDRSSNPLPSITLPKGGGAIRDIGEKFSVNAVTGTAAMSIPIKTSPGRSGFGPQLSLSYDSGSGNGPFGFGWHLSLPSITRKTDKGLPRYWDEEESDVFILAGAEDLVPILEFSEDGEWKRITRTVYSSDKEYRVTPYKPRIEGHFSCIERWTAASTGEIHWRSISKDNITTLYGEDNQSRIFDPHDVNYDHPTRIFTWFISTTYDDKGNVMKYEYKPENAEGVDVTQSHELHRTDRSRSVARYPKRIKYGNRISRLIDADLSSAEWTFEVVFDYGDHDIQVPSSSESQPWSVRPDPFSTYRSCFECRMYRLCHRVLMFHNFPDEDIGDDCLVTSLNIVYQDSVTKFQRDENRIASFISSVTHRGYVRQGGNYLQESLPPVEFEYSQAVLSHEVHDLDPSALENLPAGLDEALYRWLDLDGEGISGILTKQAGIYYYKSNLGEGQFGPAKSMDRVPSLTPANEQWMDLSGDGHLDLIKFDGFTPGFYKRTAENGWLNFKSFKSLPNIQWEKPNMQFVDLTGDGLADILIANDEIFTWYPSIGEVGFGPAEFWRTPLHEDDGPRLLFQDLMLSIYVADMTGDGLNDLVRIRNGEVCYWPNIGYGRFGAKVIMDNSPWFDYAEHFQQNRIRLADIDGCGTTDLIYLGASGALLYRNEAGNSWTSPDPLRSFPQWNVAHVQAIDLLGRGTTCLVWSSDLPSDYGQQLRYVDLMGGKKPHLLTSVNNNIGFETRVQYASSTQFYLKDKIAGKPWATKLAFPVQVVERVETFDLVSRNLFVTRYAYHHGFYDGVEREFRGFGMVEQWDTEEFAALSDTKSSRVASNINNASNVPPVLTKTWFHNGAYFQEGYITRRFESEYYRETGLSDEEYKAMLLEDTILPHSIRLDCDRRMPYDLSVDEMREACRSLKGSQLRQEIYGLDGTDAENRPYQVKESNYTIEMLQPRTVNRYASFFSHPRESIEYHYERKLYSVHGQQLADPRVIHSITLEVDYFGNVVRTASIAYGRRHDDFAHFLSPIDRSTQKVVQVSYTDNRYTEGVFTDDVHRTPLIAESVTYQLFKVTEPIHVPLVTNLYRFEHLRQQIELVVAENFDLPYGDFGGEGAVDPHPYRRLIKHQRTLYKRDDLAGPLSLGKLESLGLPFETYRKAFPRTLVEEIYLKSDKIATLQNMNAVMQVDGGYVHFEDDKDWWSPSGKLFYSPDSEDAPHQELEYARLHFFVPRRFRDPFYSNLFKTEGFIDYDQYDLLVQETRDPVGNRTTVGERNLDPDLPLVLSGQDYRVLQPVLVMDANRNRSAVAFDALGLVVGTAVMGKPDEALGDSLEGFNPYLTQEAIKLHFQSPLADLHRLLGNATVRFVYNLSAFDSSKKQSFLLPSGMSTLTRETHVSDLLVGKQTRIMLDFSYFDGFGRVIQKKVHAGPGKIVQRDPGIILDPTSSEQKEVSNRFICTGWVIYDNKGNAICKYEPFYTDTHIFEFDVRFGVSPIFFYDPTHRLIATLFPNQTWSKVVFDSWSQENWDPNDTVLVNPTLDPNVGDYFRRAVKSDHFLTWYEQRVNGGLGKEEREAACKTYMHANTPRRTYLDALGQAFLYIAQNRFQTQEAKINEFYRTFTLFDIEGNSRQITDANERAVAVFEYNMTGRVIHQLSMEAGERWRLDDVAGKTLYSWDSREQQVRVEYDQLRRAVESHLRVKTAPEILVERTTYGESELHPEAHNWRGKVVKIYDQAGLTTNTDYDFKGNLLCSRRTLSKEYRLYLDWATNIPLEDAHYRTKTAYDAINRITAITTPDNSVTRNSFNEWGQLNGIHANLRSSAVMTHLVFNIEYNAKGQRTLVKYGNGVVSHYDYDPLTFRMIKMVTRRSAILFPNDCPTPPPRGWPGCQIQNLHYTYDPIGNIIEIHDRAQQTIFFRNKRVEPSCTYTYDPLYRLIEATGREHLGQINGRINGPTPPSPIDHIHTNLDQPGDGNAMGTYIESYSLDAVGNLLSVRHRGSDCAHPGWTRNYMYNEKSQIEPNRVNNQVSATTVGRNTAHYSYDADGNMTLPYLNLMHWDYKNQLHSTASQNVNPGSTPETTRYVYDSNGQRVRKVTERYSAGNQPPTRMKERLYLGFFETYHEFDTDGINATLERETLHVTDGIETIALIETCTLGAGVLPETLFRYQRGNHLDSVSIELDDQAQIISYEEYAPLGSTTYQAVRSQIETSKRYRYCAKEQDEESGLYYYGARYYASWLGRWISCDPGPLNHEARGFREKSNGNLQKSTTPNALQTARTALTPYGFVKHNPICKFDPDGRDDLPFEWKQIIFAIFNPGAAFTIENRSFPHGSEPIETPIPTVHTLAVRFSSKLGLERLPTRNRLQVNTGVQGTRVNAVRHTLGQAIATDWVGESVAKWAADAHEANSHAIDGLDPNKPLTFRPNEIELADQSVDLRNNIIGRNIGRLNPGLSPHELAEKVLDEYAKEGLWVLEKLGNGSFREYREKLNPQELNALKRNLNSLDEFGLFIDASKPNDESRTRTRALPADYPPPSQIWKWSREPKPSYGM